MCTERRQCGEGRRVDGPRTELSAAQACASICTCAYGGGKHCQAAAAECMRIGVCCHERPLHGNICAPRYVDVFDLLSAAEIEGREARGVLQRQRPIAQVLAVPRLCADFKPDVLLESDAIGCKRPKSPIVSVSRFFERGLSLTWDCTRQRAY